MPPFGRQTNLAAGRAAPMLVCKKPRTGPSG
jgi:hypothetical protein